MHKVKNIRDNTAAFDYAMQKRGADYCAQDILALDSQLKELTAKIQQLQAMRNSLAKENAHLDKASKEYAEVVKKGQQLKQNSSELTERHLQVEKDLQLKPSMLALTTILLLSLGSTKKKPYLNRVLLKGVLFAMEKIHIKKEHSTETLMRCLSNCMEKHFRTTTF